MFFSAKDPDGAIIEYGDAINGKLQLAPTEEALAILEEDYRRMVEGGLLHADAEPFSELMARCAGIADRANRMMLNQS